MSLHDWLAATSAAAVYCSSVGRRGGQNARRDDDVRRYGLLMRTPVQGSLALEEGGFILHECETDAFIEGRGGYVLTPRSKDLGPR